MSTEPSTGSKSPDRGPPVIFLVVSIALAIIAVSLRVAGFLGVMDQISTMGGAFEAGRLQGAQAAISLCVAAGLGWAGLRGLVGGISSRLMYTHGSAVTLVGAVASLVSGIWLTSLVLVAAALSLHVLGRRQGTT